jgi:YbbR domain-containing protein
MVSRVSRFMVKNLGTMGIALVMALTVWVLAVLAADPNQERVVPGGVPIQIIGASDSLIQLNPVPTNVNLRLTAPESVWAQLDTQGGIIAQVDYSGLEAGEHTLPIQILVSASPVRVVEFSPSTVTILLENEVEKQVAIETSIIGSPALGFQADQLTVSDPWTVISGPESLVSEVDHVRAELDIEGARDTITAEVSLIPVDSEGLRITGVTLTPGVVTLIQPITQSGGYRDVAVKVETTGLLASGYRVTNVSVSPPTVTVFSSDPVVVAQMPGFVSTLPLDLAGANDDITIRLALILPEGVSVVGDEQSVTVQISIAGIETSISLNVPVEAIGLGSGLAAVISPESVDLILTGPLPILEDLLDAEVRVFVDLTDLPEGTHLVEPVAEILANGVVVDSISPVTLEVVIGPPQTPGAATVTPTPSPTPKPQ